MTALKERVICFAIAIAAGWSYWGLTAWHLFASDADARRHPIRQELMAEVARDPRIETDVLLFVLAQLALHAALGCIAWSLAVATRRAFPASRPRLLACTVLWFLLLTASVYVLNAALYPWSHFSSTHSWMVVPVLSPATVADVAVLAVVGAGVWVLWSAARTFSWFRANTSRIVLYASLGLSLYAGTQAMSLQADDGGLALDRPHIIVIGIDSLRPDTLAQKRAVGVTPNLDAFLNQAITFTDTTTPLARTFASWMAVLTGQHPVSSGARDNLMSPAVLNKTPTLADRLRSVGYHTVYATDEVRFSNIDESYGFDRIIGPKMGTSDFLLASWSDSPLTNLIANTIIGRYLFPNTYANRAAARTYKAETLVEWLAGEIDFERPTLLGVHLTLPHYPYYWGDDAMRTFDRVTENPYAYLAAVVEADRQFGYLMRILEQRGVLENAIVVVLSDHGEALGFPSDNLLYEPDAKAAVGKQLISMQGHGSSVLSPTQYQVLLSIAHFGVVPSPPGRFSAAPASLEDVTPTVLDLAGVRFAGEEFDGISLAPFVRGASSEPQERIRFTETGLTTTVMRMGNFNENENLSEGLRFFEVDPASSRIVFRPDRVPELLAQKERAAFSRDWILAAVPDTATLRTKYILVSRRGGVPAVVTFEPNDVTHTQFANLWQALRRRYGREVVTPEASVLHAPQVLSD